MKSKTIRPDQYKAVLFDSGHVLNRPRSGNWYYTEKFLELIDINKIKNKPLRYAFARIVSKIHLYSNHDIKSEAEEYQLFKKYYYILLRRCGFARRNAARLASEIANDIVFNDDKFIFFDDVESCLQELHSQYLLGIVSDTWPSLERVYKKQGLRKYFSCFVISSVHNSKKHKGKLFEIALQKLNLSPGEVVFVDDLDINLNAAKKAGLQPIKMDRYYKSSTFNKYQRVHSMDELKKHLYKLNNETNFPV